MVTRRLAANADLYPGLVRLGDGFANRPFYRVVAFVELIGEKLGIAVNPEHELGEIVGTDRKSVKALRKFLREQDVRRNLAHHIDLESVSAPFETVFRHHFENSIGFGERATEWHHDDDIFKTNFLAYAA